MKDPDDIRAFVTQIIRVLCPPQHLVIGIHPGYVLSCIHVYSPFIKFLDNDHQLSLLYLYIRHFALVLCFFSQIFGIFILFVLVGTSNGVNITDGLDGLAGGLSAIAFLAFGIIAWNTGWMQGYEEVAIFCFLLVGSLLGFLLYNSHPAKIIMGDLGSLALGGALATVAIVTRHELSLVLVGGVFVVETLSSFIQIIAIRKFHKKIFKMAPLHHHFEQLGWDERDIVKLFWVVGFLLAMAAITYGVWI